MAVRIRIGAMQQIVLVAMIGQQVVHVGPLLKRKTFAFQFRKIVQTPELLEKRFVNVFDNITKLIHLLVQITLRGGYTAVCDCVKNFKGQRRITVYLAEKVLIHIAQTACKVCPMRLFGQEIADGFIQLL